MMYAQGLDADGECEGKHLSISPEPFLNHLVYAKIIAVCICTAADVSSSLARLIVEVPNYDTATNALVGSSKKNGLHTAQNTSNQYSPGPVRQLDIVPLWFVQRTVHSVLAIAGYQRR